MNSKQKRTGKGLSTNSPYKLRAELVASSSSQQKAKSEEYDADQEDNGVVLPVIKTLNKETDLPCYTSILNRSKSEIIPIEDLDKLQLELETMLSSTIVRIRTLRSEVDLITATEDNKPKKLLNLAVAKTKTRKSEATKISTPEVSAEPVIDHRKARSFSNNRSKAQSENGVTETVEKSETVEEPVHRSLPKRSIPLVPPSVVPVSRNDMTNKFWTFVEPYCAPISVDDTKLIEDLISSYSQYDDEEYSIPPLGTHYNLHKDQFKENTTNVGSSSVGKKISTNKNVPLNDTSSSSFKTHVPGLTVQKLVSSLVEPASSSGSPSSNIIKRGKMENGIIGNTDDNYVPINKKMKQELNGFISNNLDCSELEQNYRNLPLYHTSHCFDKKVRKALENLGLFHASDDEDGGDEVLSELKQCQKELEEVSSQNKKTLENLLLLATKECSRQAIKDQIKDINCEIVNYTYDDHTAVDSSANKKKHLTKREIDIAWKLLKERDRLLQILDK